jgi:hypothetical protein
MTLQSIAAWSNHVLGAPSMKRGKNQLKKRKRGSDAPHSSGTVWTTDTKYGVLYIQTVGFFVLRASGIDTETHGSRRWFLQYASFACNSGVLHTRTRLQYIPHRCFTVVSLLVQHSPPFFSWLVRSATVRSLFAVSEWAVGNFFLHFFLWWTLWGRFRGWSRLLVAV